MSSIFISYRRDDSGEVARTLANELVAVFGDSEVFLDEESLPVGNFIEHIDARLRQCKCLLVVIGQRWLSIVDQQHRPRIRLDSDVHRHEIAFALQAGVTVIPILVDEASMPRADQLPPDIQALADQNARKFGGTRARRKAELDGLIRDLVHTIGIRPVIHRSLRPDLWPLGLALVLTLFVAMYAYFAAVPPLGASELLLLLLLLYGVVLLLRRMWVRLSGPRQGKT